MKCVSNKKVFDKPVNDYPKGQRFLSRCGRVVVLKGPRPHFRGTDVSVLQWEDNGDEATVFSTSSSFNGQDYRDGTHADQDIMEVL